MTLLRVIPPHFLDIIIPQFEFLKPHILGFQPFQNSHIYTHCNYIYQNEIIEYSEFL